MPLCHVCYTLVDTGTSDQTNWEDVYAFDPNSTATANMTAAAWGQVLGGEFCFWVRYCTRGLVSQDLLVDSSWRAKAVLMIWQYR